MELPLWAVFFISVIVVLASITCGLRLALRALGPASEPGAPIGTIVGSILGLLAFMLAFTFGIAGSKFDRRRELLLTEVNAIETTYLRADLIPEPHRSEAQAELVEYVRVRAQVGRNPDQLPLLIRESERIQALLWRHAAALASADLKNADISALFIESLNETLDLHQERLAAGLYRIPPSLWVAITLLTVLAMMAVGYHFGPVGKVNWVLSTVLALSLASVISLISDLDRPGEGFLRVSQQPMVNLLGRLTRSPG